MSYWIFIQMFAHELCNDDWTTGFLTSLVSNGYGNANVMLEVTSTLDGWHTVDVYQSVFMACASS